MTGAWITWKENDGLQLQMHTELRQLYRELGRHDARLDSLEEGKGTMKLKLPLTIAIEAFSGEEKIADGVYCGFWCERCRRYSVWPGPDWGASHYFCDECLTLLELGKHPMSETYSEGEDLSAARSAAKFLQSKAIAIASDEADTA